MEYWTIIAAFFGIFAAVASVWMLCDALLSRRKAAPFLSTSHLIDHNSRLLYLKNGGQATARDIVIYFQHPAFKPKYKVDGALYPGQDFLIYCPSGNEPVVIEYEIEWSDDRLKRNREKKSVQILPK